MPTERGVALSRLATIPLWKSLEADGLATKQIKRVDLIEASDGSAPAYDERFDSGLALRTKELNSMLIDLVQTCGGLAVKLKAA
ncbi:hypothetical protein [Duganella vulcania]|uniref:Uncharacterized protein n=1 Tax=Duganella vulcania TaxID=2692166 RepID=A0A845GFM5_9BURK|nr:hypothetical protein [Duganella vulcania]MYM92751.1 hypothetical protein [Duganella vulcania]